ncbi:MAG TPA: C1 family peptidase [Burkholderiaceae bacterium]|jgi:hypothetical protein
MAPKSKKSTAKAAASSKKTAKGAAGRVLNVRPDTLDFRDLMYVPALIEVPTHVPLEDFWAYKLPVLDQGAEGACTGFGLASVVNYLLTRRKVEPDVAPVSPRMLYENARRYDEWPGENYSGSSARGAMKGWHKHGICAEADWPYKLGKKDPLGMTEARTSAARRRPLGAYFRVNHKDLIAMHAAIAEVGALYATSAVHAGWDKVGADGIITQSAQLTGGHAFAIIAYDSEGFWIQNSWGKDWGLKGCCRISYDDWLDNGTDVWVARLGAPVTLRSAEGTAQAHAAAAAQSVAYSYADLRPHIVSVGNDGLLKPGGEYGTTPVELEQIFTTDMPRVMQDWPVKRVLVYAHGGLVDEKSAVQRLAEYRPALLAAGVYPLAFIWRTDYWTTLTNILQDAVRRRRPEGILDATKDFMLDRLDDALEPVARVLTGKLEWDQMKQNAMAASAKGGAAHLVAEHLATLAGKFPGLEIHLVGHSAGSILHAPLVRVLTESLKLKVKTCTLWAPACTVDLFKTAYLPAIEGGTIERFTMFALNDKAEQDDNCARIYNKSLLYLVSNAFEDKAPIPLFRDGVPILGMQKFFEADAALKALFNGGGAELVLSPNNEPEGSSGASQSRHHGDFDDDLSTVQATFARLVKPPTQAAPAGRAKGQRAMKAALAPTLDKGAGVATQPPAINFQRSSSSLRERRAGIDGMTRPRS